MRKNTNMYNEIVSDEGTVEDEEMCVQNKPGGVDSMDAARDLADLPDGDSPPHEGGLSKYPLTTTGGPDENIFSLWLCFAGSLDELLLPLLLVLLLLVPSLRLLLLVLLPLS